MSEQELTKWKNKYRLWRILHHDKDINTVRCSPTCNNKGCPFITLGISIDGQIGVYDSREGVGNWWCIEWIKYV